MAEIVVKKRITLEFLGEDYKDGYIVFESIPVKDYERIIKEVEVAEKSGGSEAMNLVKKLVTGRLVEGEIPQDGGMVAITKDNLADLPGDVFLEAMQQLTGKISPN